MNSIGLVMVVKNEETMLPLCLENTYDLFSDITIVDTGSTDRTKDVAISYKAKVLDFIPDPQDTEVLMHARNLGLAENKADWILVLDADEIISRDHMNGLIGRPLTSDGYFISWKNYRDSQIFYDYKLNLFKNGMGINYNGLIHCCPQPYFRTQGLKAEMLDDIYMDHKQQPNIPHRGNKICRLEKYVLDYPEWDRYKWFLGYSYYKAGNTEAAQSLLQDACDRKSKLFPIEVLNSYMVLAELKATQDSMSATNKVISQMEEYYHQVKDDFEMCANPNTLPWINEAKNLSTTRTFRAIKAHQFSY